MKKIVFLALVIVSVIAMGCSSGDSKTTLSNEEGQAYTALSQAETAVQAAIQAEINLTPSVVGSAARAIIEQTVTGSLDGITGSVDYSGTYSYDDVSQELSFTGTFDYNDYVFAYDQTYLLAGSESYTFTINLDTAAMYYKAVGDLTVSFSGTSVDLIYNYSLDMDAAYNYVIKGTINGVNIGQSGTLEG